jgi:protein TonB
MPYRFLALAGCLLCLSAAVSARNLPDGGPAVTEWLSDVVTKVDTAARAGAPPRRAGRFGTVTVRIRVAADGSLRGVTVEKSSGTEALDRRAVAAIKTAAPFEPPPSELLAEDGITELAFPLELATDR